MTRALPVSVSVAYVFDIMFLFLDGAYCCSSVAEDVQCQLQDEVFADTLCCSLFCLF